MINNNVLNFIAIRLTFFLCWTYKSFEQFSMEECSHTIVDRSVDLMIQVSICVSSKLLIYSF